MQLEDFSSQQPELRLEEYFVGETRAWGIFEDRFGNLKRSFTVDITGTLNSGMRTETCLKAKPGQSPATRSIGIR